MWKNRTSRMWKNNMIHLKVKETVGDLSRPYRSLPRPHLMRFTDCTSVHCLNNFECAGYKLATHVHLACCIYLITRLRCNQECALLMTFQPTHISKAMHINICMHTIVFLRYVQHKRRVGLGTTRMTMKQLNLFRCINHACIHACIHAVAS